MSALAVADVVALERPSAVRPAGLCPWEDADAFAGLLEGFAKAHQPHGPAERSLVERLVWIEWRRKRLTAAEAAVHVAHAFDRASEDQAKRRTLTRAGVTDYKTRDQISIAEILRGTDEDDVQTTAAIREGVGDVEAALALIEAGKAYKTVLARLDEDMRDWWESELSETEDGKPKYQADCPSLKKFLADDALPWRRGWLTVNAARPAIRAQAIAESFDPARLRQLWDMEARLDRQFEKALGMLIRLQEMRMAPRPAS
jgi:hypothetical protein